MATKRNLIFILFLCIVYSLPLSAQEDIRYIRDVLYVVIREDQDDTSEIVKAGLTSGTALTVIEESNDGLYSRVETQDGVRGWVQTQYLDDQPAARDLLEQAQKRAMALETERNQLAANLSALEARFKEASASLDEFSQLNGEQQQELENVKNLSGKAIQLDRENSQLKSEKQNLENQLATVTSENMQLKSRMENNDFLNGALAVFIGVIITLIVPRLWPSKKSEWV